jgi:hypothetical protein
MGHGIEIGVEEVDVPEFLLQAVVSITISIAIPMPPIGRRHRWDGESRGEAKGKQISLSHVAPSRRQAESLAA